MSGAVTSPWKGASCFQDPTVRRAFVQKVLGIQILILLFSFGVVCLFTFSDVIRKGVRSNVWVSISSIIIFIAVSIILRCFKSRIEMNSRNFVGLALVTLTFSFMLGTTASYISPIPVFFCVGDTILICLSIIAFNAQSRVDYNMWYGLILAVAVPLIIPGIMYGIFPHLLFMLYVLIGGAGAFIISAVFVIDIKKMMWWEKGLFYPKEYTNAALFVYLDIMLPFVLIMGLLLGLLRFLIYFGFLRY